MGCFNLKCSISNKTIQYGDKVAVIVLGENALKKGREDSILINVDDKYEINTLPVFGEYNDYGGIEYIEDSEGLDDVLHHYKVDVDKFKESNNKEEIVNQLLDKSPLMHVKREVYEYLMSEEFKKKLVESVYGSYLEYYKEEDLRENKESIRKVYNKWLEYKEYKDKTKGDKDVDTLVLNLGLQDFSRLGGETYYRLEDEGIEVPRALKIINQKRVFNRFGEYNSGNFEEYFSKLVKLDRLINVCEVLGVRLFPTLYGSQDNVSDTLWDDIYENIPKTVEYEEDED